MTLNRYTSYSKFSKSRRPTQGIIAASLKNGALQELQISDDGTHARWVTDRVVFPPETVSYGGTFPYRDNLMLEAGMYCKYQEDFDSAGRPHTFTPISTEGGIATLSKIAPLYDIHSLMLTSVSVAAATAGLSYQADAVNDWATIEQKELSLDFNFKAHRAETEGATLWLTFNGTTPNNFGIKLQYVSGTWSVVLVKNGAETVTTIGITLETWNYVVFNKTRNVSGSSTFTIYLNGSAVYTVTSASPTPVTYSTFDVLGTGLTATGTAFFISNLRLDVNTLKTAFTSPHTTELPYIGNSSNQLWTLDNTALDPYYDRVTCMLRHDRNISYATELGSNEGTVPTIDVTGYCKVTMQGGPAPGFGGNLVGAGSNALYSIDPSRITATSITGTTTEIGAALSVQGYNSGYAVGAGAYVPWLRISERDRTALTFDDDFTFEFWVHPLRPNTYLFNTTVSGITLVDGVLSGIGAPISIGTFGVTTGLGVWSHVAIARANGQLRVFINAVEVASASRSGTINFNGFELANSPGVATGSKFFMGSIGAVRFTKACRYVTNADVSSAIYATATRMEYADNVSTIYDPKTDYCYGLIPWTVAGIEGGNTEVTRLTLFKFDPRSKTVVTRRDIWKKSYGYRNPLYGMSSLDTGAVRSLFSLVGDCIVLARRSFEYAFFSKADLSELGVYASWKDDRFQHRMLVDAGPDRYVTWQEFFLSYTIGSPSTATSEPGSGRHVLQLHFGKVNDDYIFKDFAGHEVIHTGFVFESNTAAVQHAAFWNSTRSGLLTIPSSPDFAFEGDFTIEFEVWFAESSSGPVTAHTVYSQNDISISASGLTLTATVFGTPITFTGTGTGNAATFGATAFTDFFGPRAKTHHIALSRSDGVIRFFLNGVLVGKTTNTSASTASSIVLGSNHHGNMDEVQVWNGYAKYTTDTTFIPSRYTAGGVSGYSMPITPKSFSLGNNTLSLPATGMFPGAINTLVAGRRSRITASGMIAFDQELQSTALPFTTNSGIHQDSVVYHESTDMLWVFGSGEKLTGSGNIGYRWDFATNTFLPIAKQGNMLRQISLSGSLVHHFDTVSASNTTPDFGKAVNFGLTINQGVSRSPFYGSLVMNKAAGFYAKTATLGFGNTFTTGDWTAEVWYYNPVLQTEATRDVLFSDKFDHSPRWEISVQRSATSCLSMFRVFNGTSTVFLTSLGAPEEDVGVGAWAHLAIVRSGTSIFGYTNGVKTHSLTLATNVDMVGTFSDAFIGASSMLTNFATGRIQEVGISNGLARYTGSTYVVPTEPFISRSSASTETIIPTAAWAYKDDVILSVKIGTTFTGAYQFGPTGILKHTYGFAGFEDDAISTVNGIAAAFYLAPRVDLEPADLDTPGIETHALYGFNSNSTQNPYIYIWDLGASSVAPSRRVRYTAALNPYSTFIETPDIFPPVLSNSATQGTAPVSMYINDNSKWFYRGVLNRKAEAARRIVGVGFEDIISRPPVPQPDKYADTAIGTFYQATCSLTFGAGASASRSYSYGGFGRFGPRTPTAARAGEAAMTLTSSPCIVTSSHGTGFTVGLSFWHASSAAFTVELWSLPNGAGTLVGTVTVTPTGTCSLPDANNIYCTWALQTVTASSSFKSIKLIGTPGTFFIDNLTFGSHTPTAAGVVLLNGSDVAATYTTTLPSSPVTLPTPGPLSGGLITADMTAPYNPTTRDAFLPNLDVVPDVNCVTWHKITHDGTKALKITLVQPSNITHSALQDHNVYAYLGAGLYDSSGNLVQQLYTNEEMMSYIGVQKISTEPTMQKPYHLPFVIQKSFPVGDYYIATINRKPTGPRLSDSMAQYINARTFLDSYGFTNGISNAPDAGVFLRAATPVISINGEAMPPSDVISSYTVETQGITAGTLLQNIVAPLGGTGSLEFNLAAIGPSQERVTEDPLFWTNVMLLSRLDGNYVELAYNRAISETTNAFTTQRASTRFGTGAMTSGGAVTWAIDPSELPIPDRNALTFDMYLYNQFYYSSSITFQFRNAALTQHLSFILSRDYTTTGSQYKLTITLTDLIVLGSTTSVSTGLFDIPPGSWSHFAIVKLPPTVGNISTVHVCVNGLSVASVNMSVATGYITQATRFVITGGNAGWLGSSGFIIDDFRLTTTARWTPPFTPPHYPHPATGIGLPTPPVASFTASTLSGVAPVTVNFTNTSLGYLPTWAWDYTNDGSTDSTSKDASFTYTVPGTYTAKLTATNAGGSTTATRVITVTSPPAPVANFTFTPAAALLVTFTDTSTNAPTSWAWDFTDNGSTDSVLQNPTFTYPSAGTYTARLTVTNGAGSNSITKSVTASAAIVRTIDFNTVPIGDGPNAYYNAGTTDLGVGPGPASGVTFPFTLTSVIASSAAGTGGRVATPYFAGDPIYMNYSAGFTGPLSLRIQSDSTVTVECYSGTNATGSFVGSANGLYGDTGADTYTTVNITLSGTCKSIIIQVDDFFSQVNVDDIIFTV